MNEPLIAEKSPYGLNLKPGKYFWCACGLSKKQPLCDGTHKKTDLKPLAFEVTEPKQVWLCACKNTSDKPYCDGTHNSLK